MAQSPPPRYASDSSTAWQDYLYLIYVRRTDVLHTDDDGGLYLLVYQHPALRLVALTSNINDKLYHKKSASI